MKFTEVLAIYAAVLSTSVFAWNVIQSRPRIKVDLLPGVEESGDGAQHGLYIVVRNVSSQEVHLSAIDVLYPYTRVGFRERLAHLWRFRRLPRRAGWVHTRPSYYSVDTECPKRLDLRSSHSVFLPQQSVERLLTDATSRTLRARAQDQLWNSVYSRPYHCGPVAS